MRLHIGSDHAGLELKAILIDHLTASGHDVTDHGPYAYDALDDYPLFCIPAAQAVAADPGSLGIVLGGSGNGEQIAANKVKGIRAALAYDITTAQLAREHNDAHIVAMGGRMHTLQEALGIVLVFLETPFSENPRHQRRIDMITRYEQTGELTTT